MLDTSFLLFAEKVSQTDKKVLIALLIIVLVIIILFGYLQKLVGYIMYIQGHQIDTMMYNIMRTRVITEDQKRLFGKEARRKSRIYFVKKAWPYFIGMASVVAALLIYASVKQDMGMKFFSKAMYDMSFTLDWPTTKFFGMTLPNDWPTLTKASDFSFNGDKYFSLAMLILFIIFALGFLIHCQALLSRELRILQLQRTLFKKDLNKIDNNHI